MSYRFVCVGSRQPMRIQAWVEQVTCRRLSLLQDCKGVGPRVRRISSVRVAVAVIALMCVFHLRLLFIVIQKY